MRGRPGWPAAAMLLVSACTVGPDYHRPTAKLTEHFKELPGWKLATPRDDAAKGVWWTAFGDPVLDSLERQVDIGNQTLRADEAAYRNARALVDEARAALYPTLDGAPGLTSSSAGGSAARTQYTAEAAASWQIDVWGRIRRQVESDVAGAQASAATLANARLSLQATLATAYCDLRVTDELQRVLDGTVHNDTEALRIVQNQYTVGVTARSDVLTAQTQLDTAQSASVNVGVARAQYEHAIAVLTGQPPAAFALPVAASVPPVPEIPGMVPAALLERRPDVAAAERSMQSQNALVGVAVAAYYPAITLSGLFGYAGNPLGGLISSANRVWSLGAAASDAIFAGGARSAAVRVARATYDESVATYRQTVLTAFQQVEDSLSTLRILANQAGIQRRAVADAQRAAQIALNEYRAGTQAYTAVITAQNTLISAQETALAIEQNRLTAAVNLIAALGGGWHAADLPSGKSLQRTNPLLP